MLLVAAGLASEDDLTRFAIDIPQAEIQRLEGSGHDVLTDGGSAIVETIGAWLEANALTSVHGDR